MSNRTMEVMSRAMSMYYAARIAHLSYLECTVNVSECEALVATETVEIDNGDSHRRSTVAVRGTEAHSFSSVFGQGGLQDIITDARIVPWYDKDCGWCHAGFLKNGRRLAKKVMQTINKENHVMVTGHSLGAAVGLVVAMKLHAAGYFVSYIGLGSPKLHFIRKDLPFSVVFIKNRGDVVCDMPRLTPYKHSGRLHHINTTGEFDSNFADHAIGRYLHWMRTNLPPEVVAQVDRRIAETDLMPLVDT